MQNELTNRVSSRPLFAHGNSVYVRNLEERVKIEPLKDTLRTLFSEFGNVIDIVAKANLKAKGQAFIVFDDPEAARAAIEETDGFDLFGKPMQVALARTRSDATVQKFGDEEELELHKRRRAAEKGTCLGAARGGFRSSFLYANRTAFPSHRQEEGP